jgi:DNA-binding response OmpR family regulator
MAKKILVIANSYLPATNSGLLTREGYKVDMINNTEASLKKIEPRDYDVVIIQAGRETGEWQLCEQVRMLSDLPLIVISTHASADMSARAIDAGADYFLRKPFGPMELNARIRSLLQRQPVKSSEPVVV